ncbi:MAG: glycoside hydrolase family 5 protein, partial [Oscillospiraceae bacterium]|nr:glycoside hydrolase family 5 protein [Oscillospiraceae bacterium]
MKKLFSLLLAAAVSVSIFTACSGSAQNSDTGSIGAVSAAPIEMRNISSAELVKDMGLGWNLGDTLDVCQADRDGDGRVNEHVEDGEKVDETLWGNPKATKELFSALKEDGIDSVRIPVTWRDHIDESGKIDAEGLDRGQEVVDYAYLQNMYVI